MVGRIYPAERQLNEAYSSDIEVPFLDLNLSLSNGKLSTKIYDKRDDFEVDKVLFPSLITGCVLGPGLNFFFRPWAPGVFLQPSFINICHITGSV